jgi:anti-sigma factor RsiW
MIAGLTCRQGVAQLMDYLEGLLDAGPRRTLDEHVAGCPRCAAYVRSYLAVPAILRDATLVSLPPAGQEALRAALSRRRS